MAKTDETPGFSREILAEARRPPLASVTAGYPFSIIEGAHGSVPSVTFTGRPTAFCAAS